MLIPSSTGQQTSLFGTNLLQLLDPSDPCIGNTHKGARGKGHGNKLPIICVE